MVESSKISLKRLHEIFIINFLLKVAPERIGDSRQRYEKHAVYADHHRGPRFGMYIDATVSRDRGPTKTLHDVAKFRLP